MLIALVSYIVLIFVVAWLTNRRATQTAFFNGNHASPWMVVAFGMIGASISGVTFVSVPGEVATQNWHYLQFLLGNLVGYQIIAFVLIPIYSKLRLVSIYTYLNNRFGTRTRKTGSWFFLISQLFGAGMRFFLALSVLHVVLFAELGIPLWVEAVVAISIVWLYTHRVGIKAVVWTDVLQTSFLIAAVIATIYAITDSLNVEFIKLPEFIASHNSFEIFDLDWHSASFFPKHFLSGIAIVVVMNGLDQNIMQKSLTCKSSSDAQKNIVSFSFAFILTTMLFMALGTLLVAYSEHLHLPIPTATDQLYPTLADKYLPPYVGIFFVIGVVAAALSSTDSSLTALTTVWCIDILGVDIEDSAKKKSINKLKLTVTIFFAAALVAVVLIADAINNRSVVNTIFTLAGYTYGPLLGLFIFGLSTKHSINEKYLPMVCILGPIISYIINLLTPHIFNGYQMGFETILVNATIVIAGLYILKNNQLGGRK